LSQQTNRSNSGTRMQEATGRSRCENDPYSGVGIAIGVGLSGRGKSDSDSDSDPDPEK
jgi:hypothetical protein